MKKLGKTSVSQPWLHIRITSGAVKTKERNKQTLNQRPGTTFSSSKKKPWVQDPDLDLIFKLKIPSDIQGWEPMKQIIFTFSCSSILSYNLVRN